MSQWRDARLHKALECAPDEGELPRGDTRRAIQAHAHAAVRPPKPTPWWKRLYDSSGSSQRMPWNAALATVAVATLVTVLWHDREVPDATPMRELPSAAPAPAASPPASAVEAAPEPQARAKAADAESVAKPAATPAPARPRQQPAEPPVAREAAAPAESRDAAARSEPRQERKTELAKQQAAGPDAGAMPAPAPAARSAMNLQAGEAASTLRVTMQGQVFQAPLARPSALSDLLSRATREAHGNEPLQGPVELRVELERESQGLGVLEIAGVQWHWTPAGGQARSGTDGALLQALREEIGKLPRQR